jgi:hypothetical protein
MSLTICSAQKIKQEQFFLSRGLIDIETGISLPVKDYGLSELTLPAGYALPGYHIKLGINYDVVPFLGLAIQYQYIQNPFNETKILEDLRKNQSGIVYNTYTSKPWELQGMMLGFYYPFKTYKTTIDIRVLGTLLNGILPASEEDVTVPSAGNTRYHFQQSETSSSNLGLQAGIKIRHQLYKKLILASSIDYTYTQINFKNIQVIETTTQTRIRINDYTQKFQLFNFSLGIGIQFD